MSQVFWAGHITCSRLESSSALLSSTKIRLLSIPCGGQDHRGGLGPDRQSGSTALSLQPGKLCIGLNTGGREPLEGNHWAGSPQCSRVFVSARDLWGKPLLWIAQGHVEWEGWGCILIKRNRKEGRKVVTACPVAILHRK